MTQNIVRSCAPLRIGIAGGGTDVEPYASVKGGRVFNTTINKYAYCTIVPNDSHTMTIKSTDYGTYETPLDGGPLKYDGNMDLVKAVTNHFEITDGFDMSIHSEAPPGSGLGGSSTVIVSILKAVTTWIGEEMSNYDLAELAYHLEREDIGLKGGKQDQYAAAFGGFNMMEFTKDGTVVNPVNLSEDIVWELEYRSLLCYTGKTRDSAGIIESQVESFKAKSNEEALDESKILSTKLADALKKGDIEEAGLLLDETWKQKKKFSSKITNPMIDDLYSIAIANGAYGGKVSGAGGGGFMYFICKNDRKHIVAKELQKKGAIVEDFVFEPRGARSWRAKI